jgi:phosphate/sulfate permease
VTAATFAVTLRVSDEDARMTAKIDWRSFWFAIAAALVIGICVPLAASLLGAPAAIVVSLTGAITAALIPLIYHARTRSRVPKRGRDEAP